MGYPTVDRAALGELAARPELREQVTLMVDNLAHLDLLARLPREGNAPFQVCLDVDASLRLGPLHVGVRRSPVRTGDDAARLARAALASGIKVRGVMFYKAQVAGVNERGLIGAIVRLLKRLSLSELQTRREEGTGAVRAAIGGEPLLVNGGGSGSVAETAAAATVTEVAAGPGLFVPTLFDHYSTFSPRPAAYFGLEVVRRPSPA